MRSCASVAETRPSLIQRGKHRRRTFNSRASSSLASCALRVCLGSIVSSGMWPFYLLLLVLILTPPAVMGVRSGGLFHCVLFAAPHEAKRTSMYRSVERAVPHSTTDGISHQTRLLFVGHTCKFGSASSRQQHQTRASCILFEHQPCHKARFELFAQRGTVSAVKLKLCQVSCEQLACQPSTKQVACQC